MSSADRQLQPRETPERENEIQARLEARAEDEMDVNDIRFQEWLTDGNPGLLGSYDFCALLAYLNSGKIGKARDITQRVLTDYQQYRAATASRYEKDEIYSEILDDERLGND